MVGRDLLAVHLHDDVALLDAGASARAVGDDRADDLAAVLWKSETGRQVLIERLEADAEIAARTGRCPCISESMTGLASSAGIARPIPTDAPVGEISAELMPMTLPSRSNIGPPLLPMLIAASV